MTGFNINTFISDIRTRGVVKTHSFLVNIVPPKTLQKEWSDTRNILIRCDSASLPAVNFQSNELVRHGYGPQESSPHNIQFEPVNLSFILDSNAEIYKFWYTWINTIINFNRSKGLNTPDEAGKMPYEISYKDDYSTEIKILVYNEASDNIIQVSLQRAFPLGIGDLPLNWASTDEIARLNIPISYRDFYAETISGSTAKAVSNFISPSKTDNAQYKLYNLNSQKTTSKLDQLISDIKLN